MGYESKQAISVIYCEKGGQHQGQRIQWICLHKLCRQEKLCCDICKQSQRHMGHSLLCLKRLFDDLEYKTKKLEKKSDTLILQEIDDIQSNSLEAMQNLRKYINTKLDKMESKMVSFYQDLKKDIQDPHIGGYGKPAQILEVEKLRYEFDPQVLEKKMITILDNVVLAQDKVITINEEFFGSKSTEPIKAFAQSFLETLKEIHLAVRTQYTNLIKPAPESQIKKRDYFFLTSANNTHSSQPSINGYQSKQNQKKMSESQPTSDKIDKIDNFDTISFSSKQIQNSQSDTPLLSNTEPNNIGSLAIYPSTVAHTFYNLSNISQMNQAQLDIQNQINQQLLLLQQLQTKNISLQEQLADQSRKQNCINDPLTSTFQSKQPIMSAQETNKLNLFNNDESKQQKSYFENLQEINQVKQSNGERETNEGRKQETIDGKSQITRKQINRNRLFEGGSSNISIRTSQSPPQRLMYYSNLFHHHLQDKDIFSRQSKDKSSQIFSMSPLNNSFNMNGNKCTETDKNNHLFTSKKKTEISKQCGMEQEIEDIDFQPKKTTTLPKSTERQFHFRFHKEYKHSSIECFEGQLKVKGNSDNQDARLALLSPSVETKPIQEFHWALKIISCKSMAYSSPLAIGICFKKFAENNQYQFPGEDTSVSNTFGHSQSLNKLVYRQLSTASTKGEESLNGCYLLTATGFIRNHTDQQQDMKKVQVRFDQGDILHCYFNPFRKYLKIKNSNSREFCMINIQFKPTDTLYPCVRISYSQDIVEIIDNIS